MKRIIHTHIHMYILIINKQRNTIYDNMNKPGGHYAK